MLSVLANVRSVYVIRVVVFTSWTEGEDSPGKGKSCSNGRPSNSRSQMGSR